MKTGIKIVTQSRTRHPDGSFWQNTRVFNQRVGMAELREILHRGTKPLAVGSEEGQMVVHFGPLLFTRKGAL